MLMEILSGIPSDTKAELLITGLFLLSVAQPCACGRL
jgi:hypothetical protein